MSVTLCKDEQEIWELRRSRLEALMVSNPSQRRQDSAQSDKIMNPQLFSVAKEGNIDKLIKALEDHWDKERLSLPVFLRVRRPSENTLLHVAAVIDFVPQQLIFCKNSRGETPLHIAARAGRAGAVELLLPRGNPACTDHSSNSPLHEAVRSRRYDSPLHEAVRNRRYDVIRRLLREDPNPLYRQNKGRKSPWCLAVETGDLDVLRILLEAPNEGEDQRRSESESVFGMSPVHVAITYQNLESRGYFNCETRDKALHYTLQRTTIISREQLMRSFPATAMEQDSKDGYLPIHVACMMDNVEIVEELLGQWSDPAEFLARLGQNVLHVSEQHGYRATVKYILKRPNFTHHVINARDLEGNTPLHLAALHCQFTVRDLAQDERVDRGLLDNNNMTALDVVEQDIKTNGNSPAKRLLQLSLKATGTGKSSELAITISESTGGSSHKQVRRLCDWQLHRHAFLDHGDHDAHLDAR